MHYNEVFSTQVRVIDTSLATSISGILLTLAPKFLTLCVQNEVPIMLLFGVILIVGIAVERELPETFNVPPREIIE